MPMRLRMASDGALRTSAKPMKRGQSVSRKIQSRKALAASVAKSYVGEAARKVCGSAIQVHGGIGFTWEYDLHLYFKQAKLMEALYGDAEHHRAQILEEVMQPAAVPVLA